ncbi:MAG: chemotaxis protein [Candidatus Omnitrophica bacterium 4484_70.2]|nr:MAG: chemotaxis protein [Candidatus Omnitrophica bacterium 4484_70.2]
MELSIKDFIKFRDLIYKKTGLFFEEKKIYFLKKRLSKRMEELEIKSTVEYYQLLSFGDKSEDELQRLIDLLTTNETYFFREFEQLQAFAEYCLPEICEKKEKNSNYKLKIWSAGCSTGEEPYTLAIILLEMLDNFRLWDKEIVATDIDSVALKRAERGVYDDRSVKDVPEEYFAKYFTTQSDGYRVTIPLRKMVTFYKLNLFDDREIARHKNFDFIFCRNVLIYFNDLSRRKVVNYFYEALNPGGYIFLGHSESMSRISSAFKITRKGDFIVYKKPEGD